jgi:eukaryotic-like serine/threonine-protein kinase
MTQVGQQERNRIEHADTLRISMLGGFHMSFNEHEIPDTAWRLGKARSMVKLLALSPEHCLHREQIIDLLWYDLSPEAGTNNFHQALHVARRTVGSILPGVRPTEILRLRQQILSLDPPFAIWTDVDAFESAIRSTLNSSEDIEVLYQAVDIYAGDLLPEDRYEDWTLERRDQLREQYLSLLLRIASVHESRRESTPAIDVLRRVVSLEPLREEAYASLMRIYALSDRRQQALRQYERLRDTLEREIDAEPDPVVTDLYEAIARGVYPAELWHPEVVVPAQDMETFELGESITAFLERKSDFVDRHEELQVFEQGLSGAIHSEGKIVLVAGEPGIGKTRLIEEFTRFCRAQQIPAFWGRGYDGPGAPPYWPWVQIVREYLAGHSAESINRDMGAGASDIARIVPELLETMPSIERETGADADQERFRLFDSLTSFFSNLTRRAPLVLVLDDLHWFDRSSLLMLEFIAREMQDMRLLLLGSYRPVEIDRHHPLIRTLAELARSGLGDRIHLEGLSSESVARYSEIAIGATPPNGLADAIHFQTDGNPFFVREIVQLLVDEDRLDNPGDIRSWRLTIPHGILETVNLRVDRLSEVAHQSLVAAAVVGHEFDLDVLAAVTGQSTTVVLDALDEALGLGLVIEIPGAAGRLRFSHSITREAIADGLTQARRLRLHLRTGEALQQMAPADVEDHLADLAHHFAAAAPIGAADRAIDYLQQAARQAASRVAHSEAANYLRRAVDICIKYLPADISLCCELYLQLGDALTGAGDSTEAQVAHERAAAIARSLGDARLLARSAIGIFEAGFYSAYAYKQFVSILEEGLQGLSDEDADLRVRILSRLATSLQENVADRPRMICVSNEATRLAIETGNVNDLPFALYARLLAQWSPHTSDRALQDANDLIGAANRAADVRMALIGHASRTFLMVENGDFAAVDEAIEAYGDIVRESRQRHYDWSYRLRIAMRKLMTGPLDEAEQSIDQALEVGLRTWPGPARANHFQQLFYMRRLQGRSNELIGMALELIESYPDNPMWRCMLINLYLDVDNATDARCEFDRFFDQGLETLTLDNFWLANLALLAEACARIPGNSSHRRQLLDMLEPFGSRFVSPGANAVCLGPVNHFLALLARADGDQSLAAEFQAAAIEQCLNAGQLTLIQSLEGIH